MPDRKEVSRINAHSQSERDDFLRRNSLTYLECATSVMLTHMTKREVVEVLRRQAQIVQDFD